jgi:hypothetical protein
VSTGSELFLRDARTSLERAISRAADIDLADRAFAAWVLGQAHCPFDVSALVASCVENRNRGYREVAALGYAAELTSPACGFRTELCEVLAWLSRRPTTICGTVAGFVSDPIGLLGIALGSARCGQAPVESAVTVWFENVLTTRTSLPSFELWEVCLVAAAAHRLSRPGTVSVPTSSDTADCRLVLRSRGALPQAHPADMNADEVSLVSLLLTESEKTLSYPRLSGSPRFPFTF